MSIITKPLSIVKNSAAEFTLDKAALAAVASVAANAYYSVSSNWSKVILQYKSSAGNQKELLEFNASLATPTSSFLVSSRARDIFQVNKIVIVDFDGGTFIVPRSQLTVAEFDIDMSVTPPIFLRDFASPNSIQSFETMTSASISGNVLNCYKAPYSAEYTNTQSISNLVVGDSYKVRVYVNAMSSHPDYSGISDDFRFSISLEMGTNGNPSQVVYITGSQMRSAVGAFHESTFVASSLNVPSYPIKMLSSIYFQPEFFSLNKIEIIKV